MIVYFVHDARKESDLFVLPETGRIVTVTAERFGTFIAPCPVFAEWPGKACGDLAPEAFGTVVATRDDAGDVTVVQPELWRRRMDVYLAR